MCQEDVGGETYLPEFATNSGLSMVISVYKPLYKKIPHHETLIHHSKNETHMPSIPD